MFKKKQKDSSNKYKVGIIVLATCLATLLCTGFVFAVDDASIYGSPEQVESQNAIMEQAFHDVPQIDEQVSQALVDKMSDGQRVPVIVRLREVGQPYGIFSDKQRPRTEIIADLQTTALDDLIAQTSTDISTLHVKKFTILPGMALQVNAAEFKALLDHPGVIDIVEDIPVPPTLDESIPLIGGDGYGTFDGYTGQGQTVAILDTGVDKNHPFFSGKVVEEACYSTNDSSYPSYSLCPKNKEESTSSNSGLNCHTSITGCDHGTHVAGIAAGQRTTLPSGVAVSGVAQDASIIAIQVFSMFEGYTYCGASSPCAKSFTSDQLKGLEQVYALRKNYSIAAVNMSLGGGEISNYCNTDIRKPIIDTLRAAGIATVVASGNEGYKSAMGAPACIESAVSVGNTTKWDQVADSSNSAYFLDLLAPGTDIFSSLPDGHGGELTGTSMAAPHVAGAWAVIKQARRNASVDEVLAALRTTGVSVVDRRYGAGNRVTPRIDVQAALESMACNVEWDLDGDCEVSKEDATILKNRQKDDKTYLKVLFKTQKDEIKFYMGWYYDVCGTGYDLNGNCVIDKEDAKLLKLWQKDQKTYYKNLHKYEKDAMKAALKHQYH